MNAVEPISELVPLVIPASRPVWMERQWVAIDGAGTVRNGLSTGSNFAGTSKAAEVLARVIPGLQIAGGLLITYSACKYTVPNSWREFKAIHPEDGEGKWVSGLGFVNQLFYLSFGPALTVSGATAAAGLATGSSALLQASEIAAYGVLGGLCVARALVMATRSAINLSYLIPFHDNFQSSYENGEALSFLKKEMGTDEAAFAAFKRRVGDGAAEKVKDYFEGRLEISPEELIRVVDKGIFKQKCKQWLTLSIAIFMLIGGIASLVFSGGLTALAVGAIIGISFLLMEADWLLFDKSSWFDGFVDSLYKPLEEIPAQKAIEEPVEEKAQAV